jgi:TonB-dependent receptor
MQLLSRTLASLALAALPALPALTAPAPTGSLTGRVVDETHRAPLPGASVRVRGLAAPATTGMTGEFRLAEVPVGTATVEVSYVGFQTAVLEATVAPGTNALPDVPLRIEGRAAAMTVVAEPLLQGQAKALSQQKNAMNILNVVSSDQIGAFPDPNSAEATQRIPGVLVQRDQGEGRYVVIRGAEPRLNATMIDGERIPAPEQEIRNVALDVVPANLLEAIEVTKALTPDMDGDAVGGVVNLVTKEAPLKPRASADLGIGYNDIVDDTAFQGALTGGALLSDGRLGLAGGISYLTTDRGSQNFEASYDDGDLDELELRDYTINRERFGLTGRADVKASETSSFRLRGIYNQFDDQEYRRRTRNQVSDKRMERELKDRYESQTIWSASAGGSHFLGGAFQLDYQASYAFASEDEPDSLYTTFRQKNVAFAPNVSPTSIDPDNVQANPLNEDVAKYKLNDMSLESNLTKERDVVGKVDLLAFLPSTATFGGNVKAGVKYRDKKKDTDVNTTLYEPEDDVFLTSWLDTGFKGFSADRQLFDGRYVIGPHVDPTAARRFLTTIPLESEIDWETETGDYQVKEKTFAGYAMAELFLGEKLALLGGLRYENTKVDATGTDIEFDEEGDFVSRSEVTNDRSYGVVLPQVHARYRFDDSMNLRAAITRSFARPNYADLAPYRLVLREDLEIARGNADLDISTAWNFDLMFEKYLGSVGIVSAGVFHKEIEDYIYVFRSDELFEGEEYEVTQPRNGESGKATGLELVYQNRFASLPAPFDGLGLYANYTWIDSSAVFPDREGTKASLPGQSEYVGNVALTYEKGGFSGRVALNFRGKYLDEVGDEDASDLWVDAHEQLDVSVSQAITPWIRVYAQALNLTNARYVVYEGGRERPIQDEYYRWWGMIGVKLDF